MEIMKVFLQKAPLVQGNDRYDRMKLKPSAQQKTDQFKKRTVNRMRGNLY